MALSSATGKTDWNSVAISMRISCKLPLFLKTPSPFYCTMSKRENWAKKPFFNSNGFFFLCQPKLLWYQKLIFTWKCLIENSGAPLWIRGEADFFPLRLSNQLWKCVIIVKKETHSLEDIFIQKWILLIHFFVYGQKTFWTKLTP